MKYVWLVAILLSFPGGRASAQDSAPDEAAPLGVPNALPSPVTDQHFQLVRENSPFTRSINLSDSLILTGIAEMNGKPVATLMNKETKETYVVSEQPNLQGWKMVELAGHEDLERVSAKISIAGGEVVTVRYDEWALKPGEAKPASGGSTSIAEAPRGGPPGGGDGGRRRGGDPEVRAKMMALSEEQRQKLFDTVRKKMEANPNMSSDERREIFRKTLESAGR